MTGIPTIHPIFYPISTSKLFCIHKQSEINLIYQFVIVFGKNSVNWKNCFESSVNPPIRPQCEHKFSDVSIKFREMLIMYDLNMSVINRAKVKSSTYFIKAVYNSQWVAKVWQILRDMHWDSVHFFNKVYKYQPLINICNS